jgi:hypothetical protein
MFILCPSDGTATLLGVVHSSMLDMLKCLLKRKISDGNIEDKGQVS